MGYLPHAVWAASGRLHGVIDGVSIVRSTNPDDVADGNGRRIYLDVQLVGIPGNRRLFRIRYYGPLTYNATGDSAEGSYDSLLGDMYDAQSGTEDERWAAVTELVKQQLGGRLVVPINVGGRWIVR